MIVPCGPPTIHTDLTARQEVDEARAGAGCRRPKTLRAGSGAS